MTMKILRIAFLIAFGSEGLVFGADVRVVRFYVLPEPTAPPCVTRTGWYSQTVFHNTTETAQVVRFLGVSNGDAQPNAKPLTIAAHQTGTLNGTDTQLNWEPAQSSRLTALWVNYLDAPTGVIVANRVASSIFQPDSPDVTHLPCTGTQTNYIGLPLPVFSAFAPAGVSQYFLGTDVGSDPAGNDVIDSRLNIGVYNGGSSPASAQVRVYCSRLGASSGFSDALLQTDQFAIPANSLGQKTVLASTLAARCPNAGQALWYAVVTVDQPSFAYAIGISNGTLPKFPGTVALTYTGN
jgi:hypothetical protein